MKVELTYDEAAGLLRLLEACSHDINFCPSWNSKHAEIVLRDAIHKEAMLNPSPDGYPHD